MEWATLIGRGYHETNVSSLRDVDECLEYIVIDNTVPSLRDVDECLESNEGGGHVEYDVIQKGKVAERDMMR